MAQGISTYSKYFNFDAIISLAADLRGRSCTCDMSKRFKAGSLNWVIFLTFDDGIEWVFRAPRMRIDTIVSDESACKMLKSEVSTLKYLKANTTIPVPDVYSFSDSCDNEIRTPYILMSKASGRELSAYDWVGMAEKVPGYSSPLKFLPLSNQNREKVMYQLGVIMSSLSEIHFDKIGSLFTNDDGSYSIGECLCPSLLWQWRDSLEDIDRGPYSSDSQYFGALVSTFIAHAKELSLTPHLFFAPIPQLLEYSNWTNYYATMQRWYAFCGVCDSVEDSANRLSFCIAGQFLTQMTPHFLSGNQDFVLHHPDLHSGNIFVDEDFNITCIIDWGSASSGPLAELHATPGLSGSISPPEEPLVSAFRSGFGRKAQPSPEEWKRSEMIWHFSRLVRLVSVQDYTHFKRLYELVYETGSDEVPRLFREQSMQEHNIALLAALQEDDYDGVDEREYAKAAPINVTIARKIKLSAGINPNFVADSRLWRWIEDALEESGSE